MDNRAGNGRPPMVVAWNWVAQITTVSLEMCLPAALGYWLDSRWGTDPWLVVVGAGLGFFTGMKHLLQLVGNDNKAGSSPDREKKKP